MQDKVTIALDGMGGDHAPNSVVEGAVLALERHPNLSVLIYGDEGVLEPIISNAISNNTSFAKRINIHHCTQMIASDEKASQAMRNGRNSTMGQAIQAVKEGEADAIVSSGNTGALMALALFTLRTLSGIDRPAICSACPTMVGQSCILDLGANVECSSDHLVQFAVMGEVFARTVMDVDNPTIGLLNIGVESMKGNDTVRQAAAALEASFLSENYHGFIEGDDIGRGVVDVIVTDGFTGNIALKTIEGTAKLITQALREAFETNWFSKLGYLITRPTLGKLKEKLDPRRYNGAVLLGLNGIVVKSHGSSDEIGFSHAITVGYDMATHGFYERIAEEMDRMRDGINDA